MPCHATILNPFVLYFRPYWYYISWDLVVVIVFLALCSTSWKE